MPDRIYPPPESKTRFFYGYLIVIAVFLIQFVMGAAFTTFGIFYTPLQTEFGWSSAVTSAVASLSMIAYGLVTVVSGRLCDRFGPRTVILASGILLALGFILSSQVRHIWQIYLFAGIITGIGVGGAWVPSVTLVPRWFIQRRGFMTGVVLGGVAIGSFVGALTISRLIEIYDWRLTYVIQGVAILVIMTPASLLLKRDPAEKGQRPYGAEAGTSPEFKHASGSYSLREALQTSQFWLFFFVIVCFGYIFNSYEVHIVPHAIHLGISSVNAANLLAINMGVSILGSIGLGSLADRVGYRRILIMIYVIYVGIFFWLVYARELWALYLISVLFGCTHGGLATLEVTISARLFGVASLGVIVGLIELGDTIGTVIGPFASGYLFDVNQDYQVAFLLCDIFAVIGLILVLLLKLKIKKVS